MAWSVGRLKSRASLCTTGIANSCANIASWSIAAGSRPTLEVTISGNSALAIRCAASSMARGVHQAADRVGGADGDMHHHGGDLARGAVIAVRHRHGDVLVRNRDESGKLGLVAGVAGERFHDRGKIGARIGEHVFDAALAETREVGFGDHFLGRAGVVHGAVLVIRWPLTVPGGRTLSMKPVPQGYYIQNRACPIWRAAGAAQGCRPGRRAPH